jgi:hypothetical protein
MVEAMQSVCMERGVQNNNGPLVLNHRAHSHAKYTLNHQTGCVLLPQHTGHQLYSHYDSKFLNSAVTAMPLLRSLRSLRSSQFPRHESCTSPALCTLLIPPLNHSRNIVSRVVYAVQYITVIDARRCFIFGFTIENSVNIGLMNISTSNGSHWARELVFQ